MIKIYYLLDKAIFILPPEPPPPLPDPFPPLTDIVPSPIKFLQVRTIVPPLPPPAPSPVASVPSTLIVPRNRRKIT
jgi:hypothetical protein